MSTPVSDREERILGIIETARGKRAKFRDDHITMAHGAGGKATQGLIEGLFVPAFGSGALEVMAHQTGDIGIVFDNKYAWFHRFIVARNSVYFSSYGNVAPADVCNVNVAGVS